VDPDLAARGGEAQGVREEVGQGQIGPSVVGSGARDPLGDMPLEQDAVLEGRPLEGAQGRLEEGLDLHPAALQLQEGVFRLDPMHDVVEETLELQRLLPYQAQAFRDDRVRVPFDPAQADLGVALDPAQVGPELPLQEPQELPPAPLDLRQGARHPVEVALQGADLRGDEDVLAAHAREGPQEGPGAPVEVPVRRLQAAAEEEGQGEVG